MRFHGLLGVSTTSRNSARTLGLVTAVGVLLSACSSPSDGGNETGGAPPSVSGVSGTPGVPAGGPGGGGGMGSVISGSGSGGTGTPVFPGAGTTSIPGAGGAFTAGGSSSPGSAGTPAAGGVPGGVSGGTGGGMALPTVEIKGKDHCLYGYDPLPSDDTMKSGPDTSSGDTVVQPEVLQWMTDNKWQGSHVIWHAVRGCTIGTAAGLLGPLGFPNICKDYPVLIPADQNCSTKSSGDGYQFLLFHRHMIQSLKQLWPKHKADFDGFTKWPTTPDELPEMWKSKTTWSQQILDAAQIADNIDKPENFSRFPDEGALGYWLQCPVGSAKPQFLSGESVSTWPSYTGLHFNLHDQWSRGANAKNGLNNGQVNVTNYMFWKLHGWIDNVWEKYRIAKGLTKEGSPEMQKYRQDLAGQCREMDIEAEILKKTISSGQMLDCPPDVDETGEFHTKVRPIFETDANHCSSCHGPAQTSPYAGLRLGGAISSKCVVEGLKSKPAIMGGGYNLVEPGDPEHSWLYLKAAGLAGTTGCKDASKPCNTATMPPSGKSMTEAELKILYDWIKGGANP